MANLPRLTDASLAEIEQRSEMADKIALPWIVKAKGYTLTHQEVITLCLAACDVPALLAEVRALRARVDPTDNGRADRQALYDKMCAYTADLLQRQTDGKVFSPLEGFVDGAEWALAYVRGAVASHD